MALDAIATSFALTTAAATNTQNVAVVGVTPKVVLFGWTANTAMDTQANNIQYGYGWMQSVTKRAAGAMWAIDAQSPGTAGSNTFNDAAIRRLGSAGSNLGAMDFSAVAADSFTIVVDTQSPQAVQVNALALGGTPEYNLVEYTVPTGTGHKSFAHGLSGVPECFIVLATFTPTFGTHRDHGTMGVSWATRAGQQAATACGIDHNVNPTKTQAITTTTRCFMGISASTDEIAHEWNLVSMDETNITVDVITNVAQPALSILCIRGVSATAGTFTSRTDTNTTATPVPHTPKVVFAMSTQLPTATETATAAPCRHGFGWATGAGGYSATVYSEDNLATSDVMCRTSNTVFVPKWNRSGTSTWVDGGTMDLDSLDAAAFTVDQLTADGQNTLIPYLSLGDPPGRTRVRHHYRQMAA